MKTFNNGYFFLLLIIGLTAFSQPVFCFDLLIPDTGQDLCYDWERIICDEWHMEGFDQICESPPYCPEEGEDFYGQDASYTINPPDLTDNGNGTVTDNLTGLMWEQKNEENDFLLYTYSEATSYCADLSLAEHGDWRMPTRKEHVNLLNLGRLSPALDTTYFPFYIRTNNVDIYYWTSTDYHPDPTRMWVVQLSFGIMETKAKEEALKVRCVRGDTEPVASYTDNGNGTVTDNVTGFMWEQKTDDGGSRDKDVTQTWLNALNYCEDLTLGDFSDWRLPNPKELERIVDSSASDPAVDTAYFPNTNSSLYWTSSTCVGCHKFKAFAYDFSDGELYFGIKYRDGVYHENYVRCLRNSPHDNCPYISNPGQEDTFPPGGNNCGDACECEGNFDGDEDCDGSDAHTFKEDFGRHQYNDPCESINPCTGNFDCDEDVDGTDANLFKTDFGRHQYNNPCPNCVTVPWCE